MNVIRLTLAQALVRHLAALRVALDDGTLVPYCGGVWSIFGHGNVAGLGEAVFESELADPRAMPYHQGRNEQGMVHVAAAFARHRNRLSTLACISSIGPGSTNMVTGAALATVNRLPVLLLMAQPAGSDAVSPMTSVEAEGLA